MNLNVSGERLVRTLKDLSIKDITKENKKSRLEASNKEE